jgi:hypothetical protein
MLRADGCAGWLSLSLPGRFVNFRGPSHRVQAPAAASRWIHRCRDPKHRHRLELPGPHAAISAPSSHVWLGKPYRLAGGPLPWGCTEFRRRCCDWQL